MVPLAVPIDGEDVAERFPTNAPVLRAPDDLVASTFSNVEYANNAVRWNNVLCQAGVTAVVAHGDDFGCFGMI